MCVQANFADIYLRGMRDRSMRSGRELAREIQLTDWSTAGEEGKLLFAAVRKNSSKLTFSRSTEVLTVALATSELKACAGGILLRGIILHWQRCSLRVLV